MTKFVFCTEGCSYQSQSFNHQVCFLPRPGGIHHRNTGCRVSILYSSSLFSPRKLSPGSSVRCLKVWSQSFIHQVCFLPPRSTISPSTICATPSSQSFIHQVCFLPRFKPLTASDYLVISLNPLFIKSVFSPMKFQTAMTKNVQVSILYSSSLFSPTTGTPHGICRKNTSLNPLFIKSVFSPVSPAGVGNTSGIGTSQSFIHQVCFLPIRGSYGSVSYGSKSQSFIHQVCFLP